MNDTNHDLRLALERIVFGRTPHTMSGLDEPGEEPFVPDNRNDDIWKRWPRGQAMRLARHDEIVERMARALVEESAKMYGRMEWDVLSPAGQDIWRAKATAALDALLAAVVGMGVGKNASLSVSNGNHWTAYEGNHVAYNPSLILQLEENSHDE